MARIEKSRLHIEKLRRGPRPPPGSDDAVAPVAQFPVNRADALLPFLLIRTFTGDIGARPLDGSVWLQSSPDVMVATPLAAGSPPEPQVRGRAEATDPAFKSRIVRNLAIDTTYDVWIHVWNLGRAPAFGVRVRAWAWGTGSNNPFTGFVGGRRVDLGARDSDTSHLLVRIGPWTTPNGSLAGITTNAECITDVTTSAVPRDYQDRHNAARFWSGGIPFEDLKPPG